MDLNEFRRLLQSSANQHASDRATFERLAELFANAGSSADLAATLLESFGTAEESFEYINLLESRVRGTFHVLRLSVVLENKERAAGGRS